MNLDTFKKQYFWYVPKYVDVLRSSTDLVFTFGSVHPFVMK